MSQCLLSTDSFIKTVFGPKVAVLCSQDAEIISRRNNLSFVELIRPFCTADSEIHIHDSNNQSYAIRDLHITMYDVRCPPADENSIKQLLSEVVGNSATASTAESLQHIETDGYDVSVNMSCPWFDAYRDTLTSTSLQKPHEFITHCPACLLVVSSLHPNPIEEFGKLSEHQNRIQHSSEQSCLRWMTPNTLKYYVLLHDNAHADLEKAKSVMSDLHAMYGTNSSYLLCINSKNDTNEEPLPDPWRHLLPRKLASKPPELDGINITAPSSTTQVEPEDLKWMKELKQTASIQRRGYGCCLTLADHDSLRLFIKTFATKGLLPHVEKTIRNFSEQIASRKAIHRSIFRATRTFFGGGKAASAPALKQYGSGGFESPELQMRKLADLFFLCQLYDQAYHYYHSVRKDFANEQAWVHAAGASEMAALSNFMQTRSQKAYPAHYVDSAIETYLTTSNDGYLALRSGLVSLECLRMQGLYAEASTQLFKLTSEEDDLRSAVLLEQIAHCYLRCKKPLLRKFAFHIVLAGHRYGKASQRTCALLCYKAALQVYHQRGWNLAYDHINFTIGRQSFNLRQLENATESFGKLLKESIQSPAQQALFVQEYLHVAQKLSDSTSTATTFPLPVISYSKTTVRSTLSSENVSPNVNWQFLEDSTNTVISKNSVGASLNSLKLNKNSSFEAVVNEPLWIDLTLNNPLHVALSLCNVQLILKFSPTCSQHESKQIEAPSVDRFVIADDTTNVLTFEINPRATGKLTVIGISYKLSIAKITAFTSLASTSTLELFGQQFFGEKHNLHVHVCPPAPKLDVSCEDFPNNMLCGELKSCKVSLANIGQCGMKNVKVAFNSQTKCLFTTLDRSLPSVQTYFLKNASQIFTRPQCIVQNLVEKEIKPNEELKLLFWIHAPATDDIHSLNLFFYYEPTEHTEEQMKYRTLRYCNDIFTRPSIEIDANVSWDNSRQGALVSTNVTNISQSCNVTSKKLASFSKEWSLETIAPLSFALIKMHQSQKIYFAVNNALAEQCNPRQQQLDVCSGVSGELPMDLCCPTNKILTLQIVSDTGKLVSGEPLDYLLISLEWHAKFQDKQLVGQHYMHLYDVVSDSKCLLKIGLAASSDIIEDSSQSLVALHQLVKWKLEFVSEKHHDFEKCGACFVDVKITLKNQYNCEIRVNVNGMDSNQTQTTGIPAASTRFLWAGKCLSNFIMPPKTNRTVTMKACVTSAGIYNLNSFSVWAVPVRVEHKTPLLPQNCHYSCLVTLHNLNLKV